MSYFSPDLIHLPYQSLIMMLMNNFLVTHYCGYFYVAVNLEFTNYLDLYFMPNRQ